MSCIRRYRPSDRAACHDVFYRAVREGAADHYTLAQRAAWAPEARPDLTTRSKLEDQDCWVWDVRGVQGFMSVTPQGYLDMAFVLPDWRGTGIAVALYNTLEDHARATGLTELTTHASHLARSFFAKRGWRVDYPETVDQRGQRLGRFAMSKRLSGTAPEGEIT